MHIKLIVSNADKTHLPLRWLINRFQNSSSVLTTFGNSFYSTDKVTITDERMAIFDLDDVPDLVIIQVSTAYAKQAYELADIYRTQGSYVCLHGMHVTSLPDEAAKFADTIILGPGKDTWATFMQDFRLGYPRRLYQSPAVASNTWLLTYLAMYASPKACI